MNLSDFFPLKIGDVLTKQHINILMAAMKERILKKLKFQTSNANNGADAPLNPFLIAACQTNTDASTQAWLEYYYTNIVDDFDGFEYTHKFERFEFLWLPYEDMFVNGYKVNQNKRKFTWDIMLTSTGGYREKDVIFSIKDACLYFLSNGKWTKDNGQIIVFDNNKILLRLINGINIYMTTNESTPLFTADGQSVLVGADIMDYLYYFKNFRNDALGGITDIDGSDLNPVEKGTSHILQDACFDIETQPANVFSPYLTYSTTEKNTVSSITTKENTKNTYKWVVHPPVDIKNINSNYLFVINPITEPSILDTFPFINTDYYFSYMLNNIPISSLEAAFVLWVNSAFDDNARPRFTASLINAIYYLVDYTKYMDDRLSGINGTSSGDEGDPTEDCLSTFDSVNTTLLCTYTRHDFNQCALYNINITVGGGDPVFVDACCCTQTEVATPIGNDCQCSFNIGTTTVSAGATVVATCQVFGGDSFGISNSSSRSISSDSIVWYRRCQNIVLGPPPIGYVSAQTDLNVWFDLTKVLNIK